MPRPVGTRPNGEAESVRVCRRYCDPHDRGSAAVLHSIPASWSRYHGPDQECPVNADCSLNRRRRNPASNYVPPSSGDPVSVETGEFYQKDTDASISGRGPALHLSRTYNSAAQAAQRCLAWIGRARTPCASPSRATLVTLKRSFKRTAPQSHSRTMWHQRGLRDADLQLVKQYVHLRAQRHPDLCLQLERATPVRVRPKRLHHDAQLHRGPVDLGHRPRRSLDLVHVWIDGLVTTATDPVGGVRPPTVMTRATSSARSPIRLAG